MKLYQNWKTILRKSWALRFMAIAAIGQTAQVVLPLWMDEIPRSEYAVFTLVAIVAGMGSRLVHQDDI